MRSGMPSYTDRWYSPGGSHRVYAQALLELAIYAREHADNFTVGPPLDVAALEHQGLTVTGPDLAGVREMLSKIPGLTQEEVSP
jgi:hypothetical protein